MSQIQPATQAALDMLKRTDITVSAVELRLNFDAWPEGVDPTAYFVSDLHAAAREASIAYVGFSATQKRNRLDPNLTPEGAFAADVTWADKYLGAVRERRDRLRAERDRKKADVLQNLTTRLSAPPEDAHTIALHREIRETLAKMPDAARLLKVKQWTIAGDDEALRAVLTVPAYLTGLTPDDVADLREMVADRQDPERFARYRSYIAAAEFAERALDGVVRFVEQETRATARQEHQARRAKEKEARDRAEAAMQARNEYKPEPFGHQPGHAEARAE